MSHPVDLYLACEHALGNPRIGKNPFFKLIVHTHQIKCTTRDLVYQDEFLITNLTPLDMDNGPDEKTWKIIFAKLFTLRKAGQI